MGIRESAPFLDWVSAARTMLNMTYAVFILGLLLLVGWLQGQLDQRQDRALAQIEELAHLPQGNYLKPALLGYHHLGADVLWLKLVQVIGKRHNTMDEYEWMAHALDVITTLDPHYVYAYYAGGVILGDLANRPDLANRLLERGHAENPTVWNIPFLLGYNHYFLMADPDKGADYIMKASVLPGRPPYLAGLATRMAAEAGKPETALAFLQARLQETSDPEMKKFFESRMKEVMIERDIRLLEQAVEQYRIKYGDYPTTLGALVETRMLSNLPREPFGGEYRLDRKTGVVTSSTHPERLRTFHKRTRVPVYLYPKIQQPAYVFPLRWSSS
ncbi:MAG: type II secretion system protein GspG [Nitrospira sp.]|nr:type II secretion system protein GspG [Nitrospira sp.]